MYSATQYTIHSAIVTWGKNAKNVSALQNLSDWHDKKEHQSIGRTTDTLGAHLAIRTLCLGSIYLLDTETGRTQFQHFLHETNV